MIYLEISKRYFLILNYEIEWKEKRKFYSEEFIVDIRKIYRKIKYYE